MSTSYTGSAGSSTMNRTMGSLVNDRRGVDPSSVPISTFSTSPSFTVSTSSPYSLGDNEEEHSEVDGKMNKHEGERGTQSAKATEMKLKKRMKTEMNQEGKEAKKKETPFQSCDACRYRKIRCKFRDETEPEIRGGPLPSTSELPPNSARTITPITDVRSSPSGTKTNNLDANANPDRRTSLQEYVAYPRNGSQNPFPDNYKQDTNNNKDRKCTRCNDLRIPCEFKYEVKKRGPPKGSTRRPRDSKTQLQTQTQTQTQTPSQTVKERQTQMQTQMQSHMQSQTHIQTQNQVNDGDWHDADRFHRIQGNTPEFPAHLSIPKRFDTTSSHATMSGGIYDEQSNKGRRSDDASYTPYLTHSSSHSPYASVPSQTLPNTYPYRSIQSALSDQSPASSSGIPLHNTQSQTHSHTAIQASNSATRLEDIVTREEAGKMCEMYIKYLWHLMPCIHINSFRNSFATSQDNEDPLFLALILSVIGAVMAAMPKAWLPIPKHKLRIVLETSVDVSTRIVLGMEDLLPSTMSMAVLYLNNSSNFNLKRTMGQHQLWGLIMQHYNVMRLFDSSGYPELDPMEFELRTRLYWLVYGADKSMACLGDLPMQIRSLEYGPVHFPSPVDDPLIPIQSNPRNKSPLILGFILISRLFAIQEEVLGVYRSGRFKVYPDEIASAISQLNILLNRTQNELANVPPALQLLPSSNPSNNLSDLTRLRLFFDEQGHTSDAFLVAQANCYVTATWIRYLILQCTQSLTRQSGVHRYPSLSQGEETPELICRDLLHILHSIPIECIASNGMPLVEKVRYIGSGLLQVEAASPGQMVSNDSQTLLLDFLVLIAEIEHNFVLPK